jgi:phosphoglycolate phosphatase
MKENFTRAMFFDFDGTLVETRVDLAAAVNHTRRDYGLAEIPLEKVVASVGNGARYLLENSIPELAGRFEEVLPRYLENYGAHMLDCVSLYPGVKETLEELAVRGWGLGIVTNKPSFATRAILKHLEIDRFFGESVIGSDDCDEMKPSVKPLQEAARRLNGHILNENDWMVGDNWTDLDCGNSAGVKTAFCGWGFGFLQERHFTRKIESFSELLDL